MPGAAARRSRRISEPAAGRSRSPKRRGGVPAAPAEGRPHSPRTGRSCPGRSGPGPRRSRRWCAERVAVRLIATGSGFDEIVSARASSRRWRQSLRRDSRRTRKGSHVIVGVVMGSRAWAWEFSWNGRGGVPRRRDPRRAQSKRPGGSGGWRVAGQACRLAWGRVLSSLGHLLGRGRTAGGWARAPRSARIGIRPGIRDASGRKSRSPVARGVTPPETRLERAQAPLPGVRPSPVNLSRRALPTIGNVLRAVRWTVRGAAG
jgi:hypothetical protein